ncbi:MAG: T9SS type A sorting domain-containing protein, partial [Bacteroidota bacterium]
SKAGYITVNGSVTVVDQNASDFAVMVPALYDIFIWTTDGMLPMGDVTVVLDGETIVTTGGPMGGEAVFIGKAPGVYPYTASKVGYVTVNGSVTVVDQNASDFAIMVPALYDIFIWTVDENMLAMGDVTVVLDGETIVTTGGPMGGEAIFVGKAPGTYTYTATKAGFITVNGSVTVVDQNASDFAIMIPAIFDISFVCTEEGLPDGLEGVEITIDGVTVVSNADGLALFEDYLPGTYNYVASKYGYITQVGTVTVSDQDVTEYVEMSLAYYDMLIWCYEQGNSTGLQGVDVTIDGVTVTSDNTGLAWFDNYQPGTYTFTASKDGYITETGSITIINSTASATVILTPNAFDMFFWCTEEGSPMGLTDVDVTIDGVTVTSGFDGLALFETYAPGSYNYTAEKEGYITENGMVTIVDGNIEEFVVMSPVTYAIMFIIDNGLEPVAGVEVNINGITIVTDTDGEAIFTNMNLGNYSYTISIAGYLIEDGNVEVIDDDVIVPITLILNGVYNNQLTDVNLYPNPSYGNINIDNAENTMVKVIDLNGNVIYQNNIENSHTTINLVGKPAGLYNVILISNDNISSHKVFIAK